MPICCILAAVIVIMQGQSAKSISITGIAEGSRPMVINIICVTSFVLCLFSGFIGRDSLPYAISLSILAGVFAITFILNNVYKGLQGTIFVTFASTLWIIFNCFLFSGYLGQQNYLIIPLVALSIFATNKVYRAIMVVLLISITVIVNIYQRNNVPAYPSPQAMEFLFAVNVMTPLTIVAIMCWRVVKDITRSHEIIRQQKQALESSAAFKDRVLSIIGHDLRTPFSNTKSMIELLGTDALTEDERNMLLDDLNTTMDVSLHTLDNILAWASQPYANSSSMSKPERVDVHSAVKHIVAFFSRTAGQKNVLINNTVHQDLFVAGEAEQIAFVLRNLIGNAIKFSHGGGKVSIASEEDEQNVTLTIKDEGVGMSEDMIASLFKLTSRVSRPGTGNEKGTGLGLIFCKEFVESNNGHMNIDSQPEMGTTVQLTLPKYLNLVSAAN